ncbi:PREDICTED: uncharacterized protein C1orf194 homolog [Ceratotherium simum simum]|uniref:Uncharacterized protein C1orf194 homolog n=1 Tax=Ceratotherium simum simum TaxID=73337 RepID=A0ABM1C764_CERSS|nr:PREDICTED: uncharacterized protein C1orf194 homolog [Ceratotherium simum simum]
MPPTRDPFQRPTLDNDDSYLGKLRTSKVLWFLAQILSSVDGSLLSGGMRSRGANLKDCGEGTESDNGGVFHSPLFFPTRSSRIKIQFPGECLPPPPLPPITSRANIRHWINPKKESIHSIQGSIVSPHTAATNGGYSRKNDGGFFST